MNWFWAQTICLTRWNQTFIQITFIPTRLMIKKNFLLEIKIFFSYLLCDNSSLKFIFFRTRKKFFFPKIFHEFKSHVFSRSSLFSWLNFNALCDILYLILQTQWVIHTTYRLPGYFWDHYPLRGSNAFTANRPFWTGSE